MIDISIKRGDNCFKFEISFVPRSEHAEHIGDCYIHAIEHMITKHFVRLNAEESRLTFEAYVLKNNSISIIAKIPIRKDTLSGYRTPRRVVERELVVMDKAFAEMFSIINKKNIDPEELELEKLVLKNEVSIVGHKVKFTMDKFIMNSLATCSSATVDKDMYSVYKFINDSSFEDIENMDADVLTRFMSMLCNSDTIGSIEVSIPPMLGYSDSEDESGIDLMARLMPKTSKGMKQLRGMPNTPLDTEERSRQCDIRIDGEASNEHVTVWLSDLKLAGECEHLFMTAIFRDPGENFPFFESGEHILTDWCMEQVTWNILRYTFAYFRSKFGGIYHMENILYSLDVQHKALEYSCNRCTWRLEPHPTMHHQDVAIEMKKLFEAVVMEHIAKPSLREKMVDEIVDALSEYTEVYKDVAKKNLKALQDMQGEDRERGVVNSLIKSNKYIVALGDDLFDEVVRLVDRDIKSTLKTLLNNGLDINVIKNIQARRD